MATSKNHTQVLIGGKVFTLSGYESEEYLQRVSSYINHKMTECASMDGYRRQTAEMRSILLALNIADDKIVALADGELIDVAGVSDPMFAQKLMGDSIAFAYNEDKVILCAPANGTLSVLFPTGHAFGLQMKNGVQILVHCGVNTVETNGDGFRVLNKKQGDHVKAGEPIIEVNMKKLKPKYDMSTMLIITDAAGQTIHFKEPQSVKRGDSVIL